MERSEYDAMTPAGQVLLWGDFAHGIEHNRSGRRRAARMLLVLAVVILVGTALLVLFV